MNSTKDTVTELCYKTSDKIINILDGLQYSSQRKPSYETELRDLIAIEVRRNVNDVVTAFYNNVVATPSSVVEEPPVIEVSTDCCGGSCGCV